MKIVEKINAIFDGTINILALLAAIALVTILLLVGADVAMRYFFNNPMEHVKEITEHLLLLITFLGAAWALKIEAHVKVDLVLNRLIPEVQALINVITSIIGAIVCLALTWYGVQVTLDYFQRGIFYATTLRLPLAPMIAIISLGFLLLSIQFLRRSYGWLGNYRTWRSKEQRT